MRKSLFLAAAVTLLVAGSAFAGPQAGDLALGTSSAKKTPVGFRYWLMPQLGVDAEIGFERSDTTPGSYFGPHDLQVSFAFRGQVGVPYNVWECSDVWLHIKPFAILELLSYEDATINTTTGPQDFPVDSRTNMYLGLALEMEAWLLECLSFSVWHGFVAEMEGKFKHPETGATVRDSRINFSTAGKSLGKAGFHLYF